MKRQMIFNIGFSPFGVMKKIYFWLINLHNGLKHWSYRIIDLNIHIKA